MDTAYFVKNPRVIGDLAVPHPVEAEREYEVAARVRLAGMDFENFAADMLADRGFIEEHAALCGEGEVMRCLLVQRRGQSGGVLVVPERGAFVGWAALAR
jgi:hypothetical protein